MAKVRRIDWSPDEFIAGTFGQLTQDEYAVYMAVLMVIYSRGGECPNDPAYIDRHFKSELPMNATRQQRAAATMRVRRAIDRLVGLGKLYPTTDGHGLTNSRANHELTKAQDRIKSAINAGFSSGQKRANREPTASQLQANRYPTTSTTSNFNGLGRTPVRNHQPPTIMSSLSKNLTVAARDPARDAGATGRAQAGTGSMKERMAALAALNRRKFLA